MMNKDLTKILTKGTEDDVLQLATIITSKVRLDEELEHLSEKVETNEPIEK